MNLPEFFIQLFGIIGMVLTVVSFQCKKTRNLFLFQAVSGVFFALNFYFLGAYTGAVLNAINLFRNGAFAFLKGGTKRNIAVVLLCISYVVAGLITFGGWLSFVVVFVQIVGTISMGTNNGRIVRLAQLFCVSPLWLLHNVLSHSIGGVLTELFNLISVMVFISRVGWNNFFKGNESQMKKTIDKSGKLC